MLGAGRILKLAYHQTGIIAYCLTRENLPSLFDLGFTGPGRGDFMQRPKVGGRNLRFDALEIGLLD